MWHFMLIFLYVLFLASLVLVGCGKSKDPETAEKAQRPVVYAKTTPPTRVILPAPSSGSETEKELENAEKKAEEKYSKTPLKAQNGKGKSVSGESSEKLEPKKWIANTKVTRKKNDYPTVDDVPSDWGDDPMTEQKKQ
ncbi:unnamed protein product, partial [Mesorhabditis belari]|uniref:Lipoprotein n=1 Tax=Mesorhabditis belari TaxID=2138241 RepID=A0AAF3J968_9BILA